MEKVYRRQKGADGRDQGEERACDHVSRLLNMASPIVCNNSTPHFCSGSPQKKSLFFSVF